MNRYTAFLAAWIMFGCALPATAQTNPAPGSPAPPASTEPFIPAFRPDASELAVTVSNLTTPEVCAEKDNVEIDFASPQVRRFSIAAAHPVYIGMIGHEQAEFDLTACDMTGDPRFVTQPRRITIWESEQVWLTGYTFPAFWRPADVPVRVGDKVVNGLTMVQLWVRSRERAEEVLVFYPPDGYWRARPLPFADMRWTAYGSSFLVGPVERNIRPFVALKEIAFDPERKAFTLQFARGGAATMTLTGIDQNHIGLDVSLSGAIEGVPFAALRSMYTTELNADVSRVAWRTPNQPAWGEAPILNFAGGPITELWAGRSTPSRHNLSAPDMVFRHFTGQSP